MSVQGYPEDANRTLSEQGYREVAAQFFSRIAKAFLATKRHKKLKTEFVLLCG